MKVKSYSGICYECVHRIPGDCFADEKNVIRDDITNDIIDCDCYEEDDNCFI